MPKNKNKQGVSLALGGGGVRAFIYIGFYEVLKKHKIPIKLVTGTSMGAVIGAAIALGLSPKKIKDFAKEYSNLKFLSIKNFNFFDEGIVKRGVKSKILSKLFGDKTFEDLEIPFACSAVNLESREEVVFKSGPILQAIAASSAYPIIFPPLYYNSMYLIDGGVLDAVPALIARDLGAKNLIAIQIKSNIVRQYISGQIYKKHCMNDQLANSAQEEFSFKEKLDQILKNIKKYPKKKKSDLMLMMDILLETISIVSEKSMLDNIDEAKPELLLEPCVDISLLDFSKLDDAIELGKQLAKDNLKAIKKMIKDPA